MFIKNCLFVLLSVWAISSVAQGPIEHETVVVKPDRVGADYVDTSHLTTQVTVISSEQFKGAVATVVDVLKATPGLQVRQVGGVGSYSSVSIRGSASSQVNVYLDGILVNSAYGGSVDLSRFLLGAVDKIEVYRGRSPLQLGLSGIGGAINIVTKISSGATARDASLGYGSFNTKRLAISGSGQLHQGLYTGSLELLSSDNDFEITNRNGTPSNPNDDKTEHRNNNALQHAQLFASYSEVLDDHLDFLTSITHLEKSNQLPDVFNQPSTNTKLEESETKLRGVFNHQGDGAVSTIDISLSRAVTEYRDTQSRVGLGTDRYEYLVYKPAITFDYQTGFDDHLVNLRADTSYEHFTSDDLINSVSNTYTRSTLNIGAQDELYINPNSLGVAYYFVSAFFDEDQKNKLRTNDLAQSVGIGVKHSLGSGWSVSSNVSSDVRVPTLAELFGDRGFYKGNTDLKSETALNLDASVSFVLNSFSASTTAFTRDLKDAIVIVYDSQGVGQAENRSKADIKGLEVDLKFEWGDLSINTSFTEQRSEDRSNNVTYRGSPLPNTFESKYVGQLQYQLGKVRHTVGLSHESGAYYGPSRIAPVKDLNLLNYGLVWVHQSHQITASVNNVGDKETAYFNGFPGPGREVFINYDVSF